MWTNIKEQSTRVILDSKKEIEIQSELIRVANKILDEEKAWCRKLAAHFSKAGKIF